MKSSEIALIVLLAAVSIIVSFWLGNMILGDPSEDTYKITYIDDISSDIAEPDIETFNPTALNPTIEVEIGECGEGEVYDEEIMQCVKVSDKKEDKKDKKEDENGGTSNPDTENNPTPAEE